MDSLHTLYLASSRRVVKADASGLPCQALDGRGRCGPKLGAGPGGGPGGGDDGGMGGGGSMGVAIAAIRKVEEEQKREMGKIITFDKMG